MVQAQSKMFLELGKFEVENKKNTTNTDNNRLKDKKTENEFTKILERESQRSKKTNKEDKTYEKSKLLINNKFSWEIDKKSNSEKLELDIEVSINTENKDKNEEKINLSAINNIDNLEHMIININGIIKSEADSRDSISKIKDFIDSLDIQEENKDLLLNNIETILKTLQSQETDDRNIEEISNIFNDLLLSSQDKELKIEKGLSKERLPNNQFKEENLSSHDLIKETIINNKVSDLPENNNSIGMKKGSETLYGEEVSTDIIKELELTFQDQIINTKEEKLPFTRLNDYKGDTSFNKVIDQENVIDQVIKKIKVDYDAKSNEVKINLKPESLGALTIKVALENGVVTARAIVENNGIKQIIESRVNELEKALKEKGIDFDSFEVNIGKDSEFNQGQSQGWNHRNNSKFYKTNLKKLSDSNFHGNIEKKLMQSYLIDESNLDIII